MSRSAGRHHAAATNRRFARRFVAGTAVAALACLLQSTATATTTVSGGDPGTNPPVIRQSSTTVTVSSGAQMYYKIASATKLPTTTYTDESLLGVATIDAQGRGCLGNNTATGGKNLSPRDVVTVTGPGGWTYSRTSPVRDMSTAGLFKGAPPANPQPGPSNTNYLGDFSNNTKTPGWSFPLDLSTAPAGVYTVTTSQQNMIKSDTTVGFSVVQGTCTIGHPDAAGTGVVNGPVVSTTTFIYRPWQHTFVDMFGNGKVFANTVPAEFEFTMDGHTSQIYGAGYSSFYAVPDSVDPILLPTDPAACAANPVSCLPPLSVPCNPSAGCTPRIMWFNKGSGDERLIGFADLKTNAFVAAAYLGGTSRMLMSLGTADDALFHSVLAQLEAAALAHGIDLASLLATTIRLDYGPKAVYLSLFNGLQIGPSAAPGGIQIVTSASAQAGVILDLYIDTSPLSCASKRSGSNATTPNGFVPQIPDGLTVTRTALPPVPTVGPLGAIVSGPIYNITGTFSTGALVNTASALVGLDTAPDQPGGYPVWVEPFIGSGHKTSPLKMDFLGTATWATSETPSGGGCVVFDGFLGTGVALYNNPLPVGFSSLLPLLKPSAATDTLEAEIESAAQSAINQATANPTVTATLSTLLADLGL
jgi:hypothetical protein